MTHGGRRPKVKWKIPVNNCRRAKRAYNQCSALDTNERQIAVADLQLRLYLRTIHLKEETPAIIRVLGGESAGAGARYAAWRRAVEAWLHRNGAITVSVDRQGLPYSPGNGSQ
jgi:hypothetical protein